MTHIFRNTTLAVAGLGLIAGSVIVPTVAGAYSVECKYVQKRDSKTGTIIGAVAGGAIGGSVANTHNKGLGTVLGAVVGGVVGSKVGKNHGKQQCMKAIAYREETHYRRMPNGRYEKVVYKYVRN